MKLAKALLGAALAGIAFAGSTTTRAEPPVYVTLKETVFPTIPFQQALLVFSVTNDLGGANRIYQFSAGVCCAAVVVGASTGFEFDLDGQTFTDDDYNSAIAPGETGGFDIYNLRRFHNLALNGALAWKAVLMAKQLSPTGAWRWPTFPESSTWAMMLLGFAGLGFVGYRAARKGVSLAA